ncbi:hypothetical protein KF840_07360 [bacterium]|nr:hypothetical protein [bacterium]
MLLALLAGCLRPAKPPPAPPGDPLTALRQRTAALRTLRAAFDVVVHVGADERRATGVLLVRPPDDARMRLVAPFGMTVFDGLRTGGRTYVTAPLASGDDPTSLRAMRFGPGDSVLFGAGAGACRAAEPRDGQTIYWCGAPPTRWVAIDPATATLGAEGETVDGEPLVTWAYSDYRLVDGQPLPFRIRIDYPRANVTVDIAVERYEVNPPLRDDQFVPPPQEDRAAARPPA